MQSLAVGQSGVTLTKIVAGGWQAGGEDWSTHAGDAESEAIFRAWWDAGVRSFDTAEWYGPEGHGERVLARALGSLRHDASIISKVQPHHLGREQVIAACEGSLRRLGRDHIDAYLVHWPAGSFGTPAVAFEDTWQGLNDLRAQGKIKAIGVSNFSRAQLASARQVGEIAICQDPYSILWPHVGQGRGVWSAASDTCVFQAYSPLAQGLLAGRCRTRDPVPADNRRDNQLFDSERQALVRASVDALEAIARDLECSLPALALAWVLARERTVAVVGATRVEQVEQNARATTLTLSSVTLAHIDAIAARMGREMPGIDSAMWRW